MSFFKDLNDNLKKKSILNEGKEEEEIDSIEEQEDDEDEYEVEELTESVTFSVCTECATLHENEKGACPLCEGELEEATKLVVKDGKVTKKKKKAKKQKMSAKQKAALAKARKKAHSASANKARAKSMKVRKKKIHEEEDFECPECDFIGPMKEIEDGVYECPECGVELEIDNESKCDALDEFEGDTKPSSVDDTKKCNNVNESLAMYKTLLDIPQSVLNEGDDAVIEYLGSEFGINL